MAEEKRDIPVSFEEIKALTPQKVASIREAGFSAGNNMNPKGRPKGVKYFSELVRMFMAWPEDKIAAVLRDSEQPVGARAAAAQVLLMLKGDSDCTDRVLERVEGKAPLFSMEVTNYNNAATSTKATFNAEALKAAHAELEQAKKKP